MQFCGKWQVDVGVGDVRKSNFGSVFNRVCSPCADSLKDKSVSGLRWSLVFLRGSWNFLICGRICNMTCRDNATIGFDHVSGTRLAAAAASKTKPQTIQSAERLGRAALRPLAV